MGNSKGIVKRFMIEVIRSQDFYNKILLVILLLKIIKRSDFYDNSYKNV